MSTTTLRVILDEGGIDEPTRTGHYAIELTRHLIETAPAGCEVSGILPSSPPRERRRLARALPGLQGIDSSALDRRQLRAAWQHGFTHLPGSGMVHAPSLLAPLHRHDRVNSPGEQIVVTIHDATAWTDPESLPPGTVAFHRAMARRAQRYADAIVTPTHAVAGDLEDALGLGERIRVIAGSVSSELIVPDDATIAATAERLGLPEDYVLAVGPFDERSGIAALFTAMADSAAPALSLVLVGAVSGAEIDLKAARADARLPRDRLQRLGALPAADLAVVHALARAVVVPSLAEGFSLTALEAMSIGCPVIHSDAPGVVEVVAGAGLLVARGDATGYPRRLAEAIRRVVEEPGLAAAMRVRGHDRAHAFSWRDAAEKTWQLHAEL
jgi:glycosyltransferase involved in cell wall biosynthesis